MGSVSPSLKVCIVGLTRCYRCYSCLEVKRLDARALMPDCISVVYLSSMPWSRAFIDKLVMLDLSDLSDLIDPVWFFFNEEIFTVVCRCYLQ